MQPTVNIQDESNAESGRGIAEAVRKGIRESDPQDVGPRDWRPLCLSLRDADENFVGGLYGATMWGWLTIDGLWVDPALRGQGYGSLLLRESENIATTRGCSGAWLGTFDFQARPFYERHGYRVYGELAGFPGGHSHYQLWKDLTDLRSVDEK